MRAVGDSADFIKLGDNGVGPHATPNYLDLGSRYSATANANLKVKLFNNGSDVMGLGVSVAGGAQLDYSVMGTHSHAFYVGATKVAAIGSTGIAVAGDLTVTDEAYGAAWDGSLEVPTKNALYDKIQSLSGGVSDGDKGDVIVSSGGATWTVDSDAITYAKIQNVSSTDRLLGRSSVGAGDVEEIACTAAGRALLDDADAAAQRATLGLAAIAASGSGADLAAASVTLGKLANLTSTSRLLGSDSSTAVVTEISAGTGITLGATVRLSTRAATSLMGNPTGAAATPVDITLAGGLAFNGTTLTAAGPLTPTSVATTGSITAAGTSATIGYAAGSGGAITQATNRTTGVTLNRPCGSITLFSTTATAGQVVTFTVTNSTVAATDTINLSVQSGTGVYLAFVTRVQAGSFNISVHTPAAVGAAEAPVINFAVLKAVAA